MRIKPIWQKEKKYCCWFCGTMRSVKYDVDLFNVYGDRALTVNACKKCALSYAKKICEENRERRQQQVREEIALINKIIAESVMHGADIGGSYDSNEEDLTEAITDWLKFKGIDNEYCVKYQEVGKPCKHLKGWTAVWKILQICEKGGAENGRMD